ncbi:Accessory secretory protein Asp1 [Staphylococcus aureus]|nr:Accessory secretory protein Asp1 [Staphylococcus aureus]
MAQLIEEKFQAMIAQQIHEDNHVIVASDARHNRQIANHIPAKLLIIHFLKIEMKLCQMRNINLS